MVYILVLLYIVYLVYRYDIARYTNGRAYNYRALCIIFVCVAGLSYHIGGDSIGYEYVFDTYWGMSFNQMYDGNMFTNSQEPLWILINVFFSKFFGDFQYLKFAIALFFNITIFWFVKKHSPRPFFSILVYAVLLFFHLNFQVLRESIAIALFLIAYDNICTDKKKYLRYYFFCLIALLVHRFSFFMIIVPFFSFIKLNKIYYICLSVLLFAAPFVNELIFGSGLFLLNDTISGSLQHYMEHDQYKIESLTMFGIFYAIIKIIPLWLFSYCSYDNDFKAIALVYVLLSIFNIVSIGIFFRVNDFLLFPFVVAAGTALCRVQNYQMKFMSLKLSVRVFLTITVIFLFTTMIGHVTAKNFFEYYPYTSVFSKTIYPEREILIY